MSKAILAIMQDGQEPIYNNTIMKTLRTLLVVVMMTNCILPSGAQGVQKIDGIYYDLSRNLNGPHSKVISKNRFERTGYSGNVVIPETVIYNGKSFPVEFIEEEAFAGCTNLKSVILPNSISLVGERAFEGCTELTYVFIPQEAGIFTDAFKDCPNLHIYEHPNEAMINVPMTVIDTLKAEGIFQKTRPALLEAFQKGIDKRKRIYEMSSMVGKRVKDKYDRMLVREAYDYTVYYYRSKRDIAALHKFVYGNENEVAKGKITNNVQEYLSLYYEYLTDSLTKEQEKIEHSWGMSKNELPYKQITMSMPNYFYRGYRYLEKDDLDSLDKFQQRKGWEFLYTENRKFRSETYPEVVEYLVYDAAPEYRVTYSRKGINEVYDKDGKLVYVPSLTRKNNEAELKDIYRLVYFKDYINNKYDIQSQPNETQEYLKLILCRDNGFEETAAEALASVFTSAIADYVANSTLSPVDAYKVRNQVKEQAVNRALRYNDNIGSRYIKQLEKDHADEFGYVYMIERLSNVSFQVVYLNKQTLEPSYCAVITYKTGKKPYTSTFSTKLVNIPDNIPPVVKITYKTGKKPYTSTFSTKLLNIPDNIPPVVKE